ncbi:DUF2303 family protein [Bradyrhizobium sp. PMVTL-01]|uniref:DUF2303 family protein n=1 Tax=Bradyrhizobium sp. PMVTL-01 TaxID=3434999 RepID=UPI003F702634
MTNDAETIAELAVQASGPRTVLTADNREFLIVPNGFTEKEVSDPHGLKLSTPRYISQRVEVQALDSLVDYVNAFKTEETMLFADIMANSITALIDYHGKDQTAANVAHQVKMALPFSEEWKLWTSIDGKMMGQLEFARFLEENHPDIAQPNAAELIEMARDLHAARNIKFTKVVRTDSDNENFTAEDTTTLGSRSTGNSVELPRQFTVRIPIYFGEESVDLSAFLRWKVGDEGMTLGIKLWRPEHVRQAMFKQIVVGAAERTSLTAVFGKAG